MQIQTPKHTKLSNYKVLSSLKCSNLISFRVREILGKYRFATFGFDYFLRIEKPVLNRFFKSQKITETESCKPVFSQDFSDTITN